MKSNILKTMMGAALLLTTACTEEMDDMTGKYALDTLTLTEVTEQNTTKLEKGIKKIEVTLADGENTLKLAFGSSEWILPADSYTYMPGTEEDYAAAVQENGFAAALTQGEKTVELGSETTITVSTDSDGSYDITLISMLEGRNNVKARYQGEIDFMIGEDDPVSSGYTAVLTASQLYTYDTQGQITGIVEGMYQYSFSITDPDGNLAAQFDAINAEGTAVKDLEGDYTIAQSPQQAWLMGNGWGLPAEWGGSYGGSLVVEDDVKNFITAGSISISVTDGMEGETLVSFNGDGLTTVLAMSSTDFTTPPGTVTGVSIKFATLLQSTGTELRDQAISSQVLDKDMKYSVYLPKNLYGVPAPQNSVKD